MKANNLPLIGNVARYDPKKDHFNLLKALSLIQRRKINFMCILVGSNINKNNIQLISEIKRLSLSDHVILLGQRDDILKIMNGLDLYIQSSSYGEGFPNVVAESMACGTPCVVTDVGDASYIVGKTGWVVPPKNYKLLADAIEKAINQIGTSKWELKFDQTRLRIQKKFSINRMISSYNKLWNDVYKNRNLS